MYGDKVDGGKGLEREVKEEHGDQEATVARGKVGSGGYGLGYGGGGGGIWSEWRSGGGGVGVSEDGCVD